MPNQPVVLKRLLGQRMRSERERAGFSRDDVYASQICQRTELQKIEKGHSAMTTRTIGALLGLYETDTKTKRVLLNRAEACRNPGWYEQDVPDRLKDFGLYVEVESYPDVQIQAYEPSVVTGLLQTEDYMRAITDNTIVKPIRDSTDEVIQLRLERQEMFWGADSGRTLTWVTTPAALTMRIGSDSVMQRQHQHLRDMVTRHPDRLKILVVDWSAGGHTSVGCNYMIVRLDDNNLVFSDLSHSMRMTESSTDVAMFQAMFADSRRKAVEYGSEGPCHVQ